MLLQTRNVDSRKNLGELPAFVSPILERIAMLPMREDAEAIVLDQLTVCNYVFLHLIIMSIDKVNLVFLLLFCVEIEEDSCYIWIFTLCLRLSY